MKITERKLRKIIRESMTVLSEQDADMDISIEEIEGENNTTIGDAAKAWWNYEDPNGDTDGDGLPNYSDPDSRVSNADDWERASISTFEKVAGSASSKEGPFIVPKLEKTPEEMAEFMKDTDGDDWPDRVEKEYGSKINDPKSQPVDDDKDGIADRKGWDSIKTKAERMLNDPGNKKTVAALGSAVGLAATGGAISGALQNKKLKNRPKHQQRKSDK